MARRKRRSKKNNNLDLIFIILLILSVMMGITIYLKTGVFGEVVSPIIGGFIGPVKYAIPVGIFFLALATTRYEKKSYTSRIIQFGLAIAVFAAMFTILEISKEQFKVNISVGQIVSDSYELGRNGVGGGIIGSIIAVPSVRLFGLAGAGIILSVMLLILLFVAFAGSPADYVRGLIEERKYLKEERAKEKEKDRERRAKEREKLKEKERRLREKDEQMAGQISINLGGDVIEIDRAEKKTSLKERLFGKKEDMGVDTDSHHIEETPKVPEVNIEKPEKIEEVKEVPEIAESKGGMLDVFIANEEDYKYMAPPISLLKPGKAVSVKDSTKMIKHTASIILKTLDSFGVSAKVGSVSSGPAVTRYELIPAQGVRVSKIANLADDIALNLAAQSIRVEAPIPGKSAVGIEVPNEVREMVAFRDVLESEEFSSEKSKVAFALGKSTTGEYIVSDIAKMPHILIAGSTGSGKSVCINTIITSIAYNAKPSDVKLILIDPKVVELSVYNDLPHLATPKITTDPREALNTLDLVVAEMTQRFRKFAEINSKNIDSYNQKSSVKIPYIIVVIDELADLMMTAAKDVEAKICRIAQMGRAAGIHLIVATQRPSVDVITGLIKANMPTRIAFAVTSQVDSRTILDQGGAEKLLGRGDMLYHPIGANRPVRIQGGFISEKEINSIVKNVRRRSVQDSVKKFGEEIAHKTNEVADEEPSEKKKEDLLEKSSEEPMAVIYQVIDFFVQQKSASISLIRRKFRMGDSRAGRIMDQIEEMGIISAQVGNQARNVLITESEWEQMKANLLEENKSDEDEIEE